MPKRCSRSFAKAGIDIDALALQLQRDGAQAFVKSWKELMTRIADKSDALAHAELARGSWLTIRSVASETARR